MRRQVQSPFQGPPDHTPQMFIGGGNSTSQRSSADATGRFCMSFDFSKAMLQYFSLYWTKSISKQPNQSSCDWRNLSISNLCYPTHVKPWINSHFGCIPCKPELRNCHPLMVIIKWSVTTTWLDARKSSSENFIYPRHSKIEIKSSNPWADQVLCCLGPRYFNSLSFCFSIISHWTLNLCTNLLTVVPMNLQSSPIYIIRKVEIPPAKHTYKDYREILTILGVDVSTNISGNNFRQTVVWNFGYFVICGSNWETQSWHQIGPLGDIQLNLQKMAMSRYRKVW